MSPRLRDLMDRPGFKTLLKRLGLVLLTIIAVKACLPASVPLAPGKPGRGSPKLIILPTDGIPSAFLNDLRERLEKQHGFEILVTVQIPVGPELFVTPRGQLDAEKTALHGLNVCRDVEKGHEYCIVLTNRDMTAPSTGMTWLFAHHQAGVSVVSLARMSELNFLNRMELFAVPVAFELTMNRAVKMINKGLGLGYYGYALSSDRRSVMFAPVMGLSDLDSVGDWYLENEVRQNNY